MTTALPFFHHDGCWLTLLVWNFAQLGLPFKHIILDCFLFDMSTLTEETVAEPFSSVEPC